MCCTWFAHDCDPATWAYLLETIVAQWRDCKKSWIAHLNAIIIIIIIIIIVIIIIIIILLQGYFTCMYRLVGWAFLCALTSDFLFNLCWRRQASRRKWDRCKSHCRHSPARVGTRSRACMLSCRKWRESSRLQRTGVASCRLPWRKSLRSWMFLSKSCR